RRICWNTNHHLSNVRRGAYDGPAENGYRGNAGAHARRLVHGHDHALYQWNRHFPPDLCLLLIRETPRLTLSEGDFLGRHPLGLSPACCHVHDGREDLWLEDGRNDVGCRLSCGTRRLRGATWMDRR